MLTVLDLFSGIGGFSLGLERTGGFKTIAFCEIDPFCRKVLKKHWPDVPCFEDIKTGNFPFAQVVCGGFPCQPFSTASHGRRVAEDLWPWMLKTIEKVRPDYVIAENVQELPLRRARAELEPIGYRGEPRRIGADDAGAPHARSRWWLCAYTNNKSQLRSAIDAEVAELPKLCKGVWGGQNYARALRISNGLSDRTHRVRALGNAVVPQIPEMIGRAILASEQSAEGL